MYNLRKRNRDESKSQPILKKKRSTQSKWTIPANRRAAWITKQCAAVTVALSAANDDDDTKWTDANAALSEFKAIYPQIMLATEIAEFIEDYRPLPSDLWNIVAGYATSHNEARAAGALKILWLRIGCLYMSGQTTVAKLLESAITLRGATECERYHTWGVRLFYKQEFSEARHIFEKLSPCKYSGRRGPRPLNWILCSIFMGEFEAARGALPTIFLHADSSGLGWVGLARALLTVTADRAAEVAAIRTFLHNCPHVVHAFPCAFAKNLLKSAKSRGDQHSILEPAFLRATFAATLAARNRNGDFLSCEVGVQAPRLVQSDVRKWQQ
jgi:hypothetical protein